MSVKMRKVYNYHIAFSAIGEKGQCLGSTQIKRKTKIETLGDIDDVRHFLEEQNNFKERSMVILNIIKLKPTYER